MDIHTNAKSCPASRELLVRRVENGWSVLEAAEATGISLRSAYKWLGRYREGGRPALQDRSSRPRRSPRAVPGTRRELILQLRRHRMTGRKIAERLKMARSTIARLVSRAGLGRLKLLDPKEPVRRYQRERPGELLHLDIKKLARFRRAGHRMTGDRSKKSRGVGWEFVHVCIDDATRLAYVEVLPDERGDSAAGFCERAIAWYQRQGMQIERVLTDNGPCYRSHAFANVCNRFRIRHLFTRPYRPQTNGKAERFIQTLLREWAYARPYTSSVVRRRQLPRWLIFYNRDRPHGSLKGVSPFRALKLLG